MKKWISLALSLILAFAGMAVLSACKDNEECSCMQNSDNATATENFLFQKIAGKEEYRVVGLGTISDLDIVIPSVYRGLPVTEISSYAFSRESCPATGYITSVVIPEGITKIGNYAFQNCYKLTSVVIPDSVVSMGYDVFEGCSELRHNELGGLYYLGNETHKYIYLLGTSNTDITTVNISEQCKWIDGSTFYRCDHLTSVVIPDGVMRIGAAFSWCNSLTSIVLPKGLLSIDYQAFHSCGSLTSIAIPNGVTSISSSAFQDCTSLASVEIPDSIEIIYDFAFFGCARLTDVYYSGTQAQWEQITIENANTDLTNATIHFLGEEN